MKVVRNIRGGGNFIALLILATYLIIIDKNNIRVLNRRDYVGTTSTKRYPHVVLFNYANIIFNINLPKGSLMQRGVNVLPLQ